MPIYEYRCESCGEMLEKIQKFSDPPLTDCPACGKSTLKKLVSASSFRLKGSGWYETDFKTKKKPGKDDKSDKSDKTDTGSKAGKSESPDKGGKADAGAGKSKTSGSD